MYKEWTVLGHSETTVWTELGLCKILSVKGWFRVTTYPNSYVRNLHLAPCVGTNKQMFIWS